MSHVCFLRRFRDSFPWCLSNQSIDSGPSSSSLCVHFLFICFSLSVDLDGVFERRCISCNLLDGCSFFKSEFSPNQTHFTLYCLGKWDAHTRTRSQRTQRDLQWIRKHHAAQTVGLYNILCCLLFKPPQDLESLKWRFTVQKTPLVSVTSSCLTDNLHSHTPTVCIVCLQCAMTASRGRCAHECGFIWLLLVNTALCLQLCLCLTGFSSFLWRW